MMTMRYLLWTLSFAALKTAVSVECPCFTDVYDLMFSKQKSAGLTVDIHRERSCLASGGDTRRDLYFTPISEEARPKEGGFHFAVDGDGIVWNKLWAHHDTEEEKFQCGSKDVVRNISEFEARACFDMLDQICDDEFPRVCPCFGLTSIAAIAESMKTGDTLIDQDQTCQMTDSPSAGYGLFLKQDINGKPCNSCSSPQYVVRDDQKSCFQGNDYPTMVDAGQGVHCTSLMGEFCSSLDLSRSSELLCHNGDDFVHRKKDRSCKWTKGRAKRCRSKNKSSKQRIFQLCEKSCGFCLCQDDTNYIFNGVKGQNCKWATLDPTTRCQLGDVSKHCIKACESKCCEDNPKFKWYRRKDHTCEWIGQLDSKKKAKKCRVSSIAYNCPKTCGYCQTWDMQQ